jgi:hypothetical protein
LQASGKRRTVADPAAAVNPPRRLRQNARLTRCGALCGPISPSGGFPFVLDPARPLAGLCHLYHATKTVTLSSRSIEPAFPETKETTMNEVKTPATTSEATAESGVLLSLIQQKIPDWMRQPAAKLRAALEEVAEAVFGHAEPVEQAFLSLERLREHEERKIREAAELAEYEKTVKDGVQASSYVHTRLSRMEKIRKQAERDLTTQQRYLEGEMRQLRQHLAAVEAGRKKWGKRAKHRLHMSDIVKAAVEAANK